MKISGMVGLAPKCVRLDTTLDKSDEPNVLKSDLEKVLDLSNLGSNVTHFGAKPTIPRRYPDFLNNSCISDVSKISSSRRKHLNG